jgi:rhomboid protease GluP
MNGVPPIGALPELPVEVYRSHWRPACDERALMLLAVGIESQVVPNAGAWTVVVAPAAANAAVRQLRTYERENPPRRRVLQPEHAVPHAWVGAAIYVVVLLLIAWLAGDKANHTDWLDAGALDTAAFRAGEIWRAVTAVTLHFDVAHLLGNLGFGAFFGWLAAQLLGPGVAFGAGAVAAVTANAINASVQPIEHVSAGASTMVFAMLGLLSAYAWRRRADQGERWAYRWAPLFAGLFMLAFTGAGGEQTDVLAHLTGFVTGAVCGFALGFRSRAPGRAAQWITGLGALALVAAAWYAALTASFA